MALNRSHRDMPKQQPHPPLDWRRHLPVELSVRRGRHAAEIAKYSYLALAGFLMLCVGAYSLWQAASWFQMLMGPVMMFFAAPFFIGFAGIAVTLIADMFIDGSVLSLTRQGIVDRRTNFSADWGDIRRFQYIGTNDARAGATLEVKRHAPMPKRSWRRYFYRLRTRPNEFHVSAIALNANNAFVIELISGMVEEAGGKIASTYTPLETWRETLERIRPSPKAHRRPR